MPIPLATPVGADSAEGRTPATARLVCRRHVDLLRVSSALCRR